MKARFRGQVKVTNIHRLRQRLIGCVHSECAQISVECKKQLTYIKTIINDDLCYIFETKYKVDWFENGTQMQLEINNVVCTSVHALF